MLFAFSYTNYVLHVCIQHLYFYEDINTVNKLAYLGLILNFIFTRFLPFYLSCVIGFCKSQQSKIIKISETQKIDSDFILKQQTCKNKSTQDAFSEANFVHWLHPIENFSRALHVNDSNLCHKRCKMSFFMSSKEL